MIWLRKRNLCSFQFQFQFQFQYQYQYQIRSSGLKSTGQQIRQSPRPTSHQECQSHQPSLLHQAAIPV